MSEQITLTGDLVAGPGDCSDSGSFPGATVDVPLSLNAGCGGKPYLVSTGPQVLQFNSPTTPVAINGVGPTGPVTKAHTLYVRVRSAMLFTFSFDGVGPTATIPVMGTMLLEFDPSHCLTQVAVQGNGTIEYLAVGNS